MKSLASAVVLAALLSACSGSGGYHAALSAPYEPVGSDLTPLSGDLGQADESLAGTSYAAPSAPAPGFAPTPVSQAQPGSDYAPPPNLTGAPQGSSQQGPGEARYDAVGYAGVAGGGDSTVSAIVPALPGGSFAEITSLDSGRTIVVLVAQSRVLATPRYLVELSPEAAQLLGVTTGVTAVRVRRINLAPQDQAALAQGQPAADRMDAPQSLLVALRRQLPAGGMPSGRPLPQSPRDRIVATKPIPALPAAAPGTSYPRPGSIAPAPAAAPLRGGWYVQVAALSSNGRAQALAQQLGGFVKPAGTLYRVQLGPFANAAAARAARDGVAGQGYADARVFSQN